VLELDPVTGQSWLVYGDGEADFRLVAIDDALELTIDHVFL
jgi:hypothetical protein